MPIENATKLLPSAKRTGAPCQEFGLLDEALNWARHLDERGRVPLLIEDDRGMRLTQHQIKAVVTHCEDEDFEREIAGARKRGSH